MKILVTGANGFVGKSLCSALISQGEAVRAAVRVADARADDFEQVVVGSVDGATDWSAALCDVDVVIHLAARVHVMNDKALNPLEEFRKVNVHGTLNLANQAAKTGAKRVIFISSIKVNGEQTVKNKSFTEFDTANPQDAYGVSKYEAELGLRKVAAETNMQVVIIRPPLIYGAGVKANFASLLRIVKSGLPLPLGSVTNNRRSFVALDNLVDLIITCIHHPNAANQTFLVSDGEDVSTTDLLRKMALAQGVAGRLFSSRLLPVPVPLLNLCAKLIGKQDIAQRLLGNLQVDISKARTLLGWAPLISVADGLKATVLG